MRTTACDTFTSAAGKWSKYGVSSLPQYGDFLRTVFQHDGVIVYEVWNGPQSMIESRAEQPEVTEGSAGLEPPVDAIEGESAPEHGSRRWGWYEAAFIAIVVGALGLRLFELSGRPMHYDEAIHLHYGWRLANSAGTLLGWPWVFGTDYIHSAWMHGPFQIEMTAVIFTIFGDSDFTSRLGYALFGTALVGLPYFLREHIGRHGALLAAAMLTLSPALLYFSRFGRNDIIMMFWAVALFTLMWRYLHSGRRVHLYVGSAILALMFATKETSYLLVAIFRNDRFSGRTARVYALVTETGWIAPGRDAGGPLPAAVYHFSAAMVGHHRAIPRIVGLDAGKSRSSHRESRNQYRTALTV